MPFLAAAFIAVVCLIIGFVCGYFGSAIFVKKNSTSGKLIIELSDPDGPYPFIEAEKPLNEIMSKSLIMLEVETRHSLPQE